jgi:hypothetical protein
MNASLDEETAMIRRICCLFFCLITLACALPARAALTIRVSTNICAASVPVLGETVFEAVEVSPYTAHFLEDFARYRADGAGREVNIALVNPSFRVFFFREGKLHRHFFVDRAATLESVGSYAVACRVSGRLDRPTFRLYYGRFEKMETAVLDLAAFRERIGNLVRAELGRVLATDLSPLWKTQPRHVRPLRLSEKGLFPDSRRSGLHALEYLGGRGGDRVFRFRLGSADTETARREGDIARAYFGYANLRADGGCELYFTIADFSIYTR